MNREISSGLDRWVASRAIPRFGALVAMAIALSTGSASATTLSFTCITNNNPTDCATGEAQLTVDAIDIGGNQVLFEFRNLGPNASSITDVYFDDGTLLGIASLIDADEGVGGDPGVDFMAGSGAPPNLPGGNAIGFQTTAGFLADSNSPVPQNGVNPGEFLGVIFDLSVPNGYSEVLAELADGRLRVGIHLQSLAGGGSESFVNIPIPEPGTALLMGMGLCALAARRRAAI